LSSTKRASEKKNYLRMSKRTGRKLITLILNLTLFFAVLQQGDLGYGNPFLDFTYNKETQPPEKLLENEIRGRSKRTTRLSDRFNDFIMDE
jgi:hypothetical protein